MKILHRKTRTAFSILRGDGLRGLLRHWNKLVRRRYEDNAYRNWLKFQGTISENDRIKIHYIADAFEYKPLISIILPVYNIEEKWLRKCIDSVIGQIYSNWELCVADDASTEQHIAKVLKEYAASDGRIKIVFRETNGHISAASNSALQLAAGEFCALLDHDDELSDDALYWLVNEISDHRDVSMIYSDEDKIDENGARFYPSFKPDWSPDLFYSINLVTHLSAYRTDVLRKIGGFRIGYEGSQDYDLALRVIEQIPEDQIRHIPRILYHWRAIKGSVALSGGEKSYAHERARLALRSHFERIGKKATVSETVHNLHRVRYDLPHPPPKAALIVDAFSVKNISVESLRCIVNDTNYSNFEVVLIRNAEMPSTDNITKIVTSLENRAERLNHAAFQTDADVYVFLDSELLPINSEWLDELIRFAYQDDIGAVGGKILTSDSVVISNGIIIGAGGNVENASAGLYSEDAGNMWRNLVVGNFSAVSSSAMAIRSEVFRTVGGFETEAFSHNLFDADLCLRLREKGLRIVTTPYAELVMFSKAPRSPITKTERNEFIKRWAKYIECDPFWNVPY